VSLLSNAPQRLEERQGAKAAAALYETARAEPERTNHGRAEGKSASAAAQQPQAQIW